VLIGLHLLTAVAIFLRRPSAEALLYTFGGAARALAVDDLGRPYNRTLFIVPLTLVLLAESRRLRQTAGASPAR
jgi:hypothetical protein